MSLYYDAHSGKTVVDLSITYKQLSWSQHQPVLSQSQRTNVMARYLSLVPTPGKRGSSRKLQDYSANTVTL